MNKTHCAGPNPSRLPTVLTTQHRSKGLLASLMVLGLGLMSPHLNAYNLSTYVPAPITLTPTSYTKRAYVKVPAYGYQDFYFQGAGCGPGVTTVCTFTVNDPPSSVFPVTIAVYDPWGNLMTHNSACCGQKVSVQFDANYDDEYEVVVSSYGAAGSTWMTYSTACWYCPFCGDNEAVGISP